jgi:hypothetical protein
MCKTNTDRSREGENELEQQKGVPGMIVRGINNTLENDGYQSPQIHD